jgi:hypothetical protein
VTFVSYSKTISAPRSMMGAHLRFLLMWFLPVG